MLSPALGDLAILKPGLSSVIIGLMLECLVTYLLFETLGDRKEACVLSTERFEDLLLYLFNSNRLLIEKLLPPTLGIKSSSGKVLDKPKSQSLT